MSDEKKIKELRPVEFRVYLGASNFEKRNGYFHYWSTYATEGGSEPVGIVEDYTGQVFTIDPSRIVFTDRKDASDVPIKE